MLVYLTIISRFPVNLHEYYNTGYYQLSESHLFCFYGFFTVPVFVILIDVLGYDMYFVFWPSKEMQSPFDDFPGPRQISSGPLAPVKSARFQKWPKSRFSEASHFTPNH